MGFLGTFHSRSGEQDPELDPEKFDFKDLDELAFESDKPEGRFIEANIRSDLRFYINAMVAPIQSEDPFVSGCRVYPAALRSYAPQFRYLRDILTEMFLYEYREIYRTDVITKGPDGQELRESLYTATKIEPKRSDYGLDVRVVSYGDPVIVRGSDKNEISLVVRLYHILYHVYQSIDYAVKNDRIVFKKDGYNSYFGPNNDAKTLANKIDAAQDQLKALANKKFTIIDSKDDISAMLFDTGPVIAVLDFLKKELCRIKHIPESVLFGRSATGLNSTQEYEMVQFENSLEATRQELVYPLLDALGVEYTTKLQIDYQSLSSIGEAFSIFGIEPSESARLELGDKLTQQMLAMVSPSVSKNKIGSDIRDSVLSSAIKPEEDHGGF